MGGWAVAGAAAGGGETESGIRRQCGVCSRGGGMHALRRSVHARGIAMVSCGGGDSTAAGLQFDGWNAGGGGRLEDGEWRPVQ